MLRKNIYTLENERIMDNLQRKRDSILLIISETEKAKDNREYMEFFNSCGKLILFFLDQKDRINGDFESLLNENKGFYERVSTENYSKSYLNPDYCVKVFGNDFGQLMSYFYTSCFKLYKYMFLNKYYKIYELIRDFIDIFISIKEKGVNYKNIRGILVKSRECSLLRDEKLSFIEKYSPDFSFYNEIVEGDIDDLKYLFKYGENITDNEIGTAKFLKSYGDEKIDKLSEYIVECYIRGFATSNKDISKRRNVRIVYSIGQEKIVKEVLKHLEKRGLKGFVISVNTTSANKQLDFDHKFDEALFIDDDSIKKSCDAYSLSASESDFLKDYSGIIYIESFGEKPFTPENNPHALKFSEIQAKLYGKYRNHTGLIREKYMPEGEISFSIIAFPIPEIGKFEEIFEKIVEINLLDNKSYEIIQKRIIDALDKGDYVHIKGSDGNDTDLKVKLHEIKVPDKETGFFNCTADVNIPVGEVFTSPLLKDTKGLLHVKEVYLNGILYRDLRLKFEDGFICDYSCSNYDNEEVMKKFIEDNLLFPHKTLPIGEFAIGTNTLAYVVSEKYNITEKLPILIVEKIGPHFAIGDTCFSHCEDLPQYNMIDGKEVIARDNERSLKRKENIDEAYYNIHTDITLPYKEIGKITVVQSDGSTEDIIREGRFVLMGTEDLNKPFK